MLKYKNICYDIRYISFLGGTKITMDHLKEFDSELFASMEAEKKRQQENIELIASENFVSKAVMEAAGSVLTNKYAEGYPEIGRASCRERGKSSKDGGGRE